jgi:uncharacterized protein (DUF1697 family)
MRQRRAELTALGLTQVDSFGSSGNFVFCAPFSDIAEMERRITEALGSEALVRSRDELSAIVADDPYTGRAGAALFLAQRPVDPTAAVIRDAAGPDGDHPVACRSTVYFVNPTRFPGHKAVVNFERELGVTGTMRTSRVVARVLEMM